MFFNGKLRTIEFPQLPRFLAVNCCLKVNDAKRKAEHNYRVPTTSGNPGKILRKIIELCYFNLKIIKMQKIPEKCHIMLIFGFIAFLVISRLDILVIWGLESRKWRQCHFC